MTGVIATIPKFSFSANGVPMVLGTLTVYLAGTTTPTDTWQDQALTTLNTNPVVLDSRGECVLWLDSTKSYKFVLKNAGGVTQWTQDNISGVDAHLRGDLAASSGASLVGYDGGTAQDVLDDTKPMASYTQLRAYTGRATGIRITAIGLAGFFVRSATDTTSADNGGTIIVDALSRRWVRSYLNEVLPEWFGAVADGVADDTLAITKALALPGIVKLGPKKYAIGDELTLTRLFSGIDGTNFSTGPGTDGCTVLRWIGASGGTMVRCPNGMHGPQFRNIAFDCNNLANIGLHLDCGTGQAIQFPALEKLHFRGYLRAGLVLGVNNITTLQNGQLQMISLRDLAWMGAGSSAPAGVVFGMILNAQNCEVAVAENLYFDPFTSVGGGPYINHQNHIKAISGGLNIRGMSSTRSTGYAIDVVGECGLVVDHWRSEDILLVNIPSSSGLPSNPISIKNVEGRSGLATGLDDAIVISNSGDTQVILENIKVTGNIKLGASVAKRIRMRNIQYRAGTSATGSTIILGPVSSALSLEETPGCKLVYNSLAYEEWRSSDALNTLLFKNDAGKLSRVRGVSGNSTPSENLGGIVTVTGAATSQTFTFATAEIDAGYRIVISPLAITGVPAAGSNRITKVDRLAGSFTVHVEAAPGGATAVTFAWLLFRA